MPDPFIAIRQRPKSTTATTDFARAFAHPDDETIVGPVLARQGIKVYIVLGTDGQKGVRPHAGIPAGEQFGKKRREEALCSCRQLGIEPPIFFGMHDGELSQATRPSQYLVRFVERVHDAFTQLKPDVVITLGPEGGYRQFVECLERRRWGAASYQSQLRESRGRGNGNTAQFPTASCRTRRLLALD